MVESWGEPTAGGLELAVPWALCGREVGDEAFSQPRASLEDNAFPVICGLTFAPTMVVLHPHSALEKSRRTASHLLDTSAEGVGQGFPN